MRQPKFEPGQLVHFLGGSGEVKSCHLASSTCWSYVVEMDMGEMPPLGRIGTETVILLEESDLEKSDPEESNLMCSSKLRKARSSLRLRAHRRTSVVR